MWFLFVLLKTEFYAIIKLPKKDVKFYLNGDKMEFNWKNIKKLLFVAFCIALIFFLVFNLGGTIGFIQTLIKIASPLIAAGCIAFVLNVLLVFLEEKPFSFMAKSKSRFVNKMRRPLCLTLTYLITLGAVVALVLFIIPQMAQTVLQLIEKLPAFFASARVWLEGVFEKYGIEASVPEIKVDWKTLASFVTQWFSGSADKLVGEAVTVTASVVGSVFDAFLSFALSIYILAQKEKIGTFVSGCLDAFLSEKTANRLRHIAKSANTAFSGFIGGQVVEAIILAVMCFVGMLILGMPHALTISILVCVMALIPIIGATVSAIVGFLLIVISDPVKAIIFVLFFIILQQLEGNLIYPRTLGRAVGIPGILVLAAVLLGGNIAGIFGSLVAVPTLALIYSLVKEEIQRRKECKKSKIKEQKIKTDC